MRHAVAPSIPALITPHRLNPGFLALPLFTTGRARCKATTGSQFVQGWATAIDPCGFSLTGDTLVAGSSSSPD